MIFVKKIKNSNNVRDELINCVQHATKRIIIFDDQILQAIEKLDGREQKIIPIKIAKKFEYEDKVNNVVCVGYETFIEDFSVSYMKLSETTYLLTELIITDKVNIDGINLEYCIGSLAKKVAKMIAF